MDNHPRPLRLVHGGDVHVLVVAVAAASLLAAPPSGPAAPLVVERSRDLMTASRVLHAWDARREAAWAASDPGALRALYVRGSAAARRDVGLLRSYEARGLVVRRIVTQVFALKVLPAGPGRIRVLVDDRVAGGVVTRAAPDTSQALGCTKTRRHVIELRRERGSWRVVSVTVRAPHAARR